jgi:hypothetical protein
MTDIGDAAQRDDPAAGSRDDTIDSEAPQAGIGDPSRWEQFGTRGDTRTSAVMTEAAHNFLNTTKRASRLSSVARQRHKSDRTVEVPSTVELAD